MHGIMSYDDVMSDPVTVAYAAHSIDKGRDM